MNQGKVYIMRNPAFKDNILKVGKTTRTSEARAKELGKPTGVPDNFVVLHEQFFEDCDKAENDIHELLKPYRYKLNKEFFEVDLAIAVKFLDSLKIKELEEKIEDILFENKALEKLISKMPSKPYVEMLQKSILNKQFSPEVAIEIWNNLSNGIKTFYVKDNEAQMSEQVQIFVEDLIVDEKKELFYEILQTPQILNNFKNIENMTFQEFNNEIVDILDYFYKV